MKGEIEAKKINKLALKRCRTKNCSGFIYDAPNFPNYQMILGDWTIDRKGDAAYQLLYKHELVLEKDDLWLDLQELEKLSLL